MAVVRKITRELNEDVRDRVRALANTESLQRSRRERKKTECDLAYDTDSQTQPTSVASLNGSSHELTATAQNLRRLAKLLCRRPTVSGQLPASR
jgi:hypothetical protein